jgi:hypothetical protein
MGLYPENRSQVFSRATYKRQIPFAADVAEALGMDSIRVP